MATSIASTGKNLVFSTGVDTLEQGVSVKVIHEAYQQMALKVDILRYPNMRSLVKSNNGDVDGELARINNINQQFKNLLQVPVVINHIDGYAFSAKENLQVSDWESLKEYELVCVRGLLFVEQNLSQRNMPCYQVSTYSQAINLLKIGRFDIAVLPEITALNIIEKNQAKNVYIQGKRLIRVDLFHYLHKKNKHILPKITAVLQEMRTSGRIEKIQEEYALQQSRKAYSAKN
jgi:ABC-type amino acid transport substrate-binding protein